MAFKLKQSTAKTLRVGPFIDDTDGKTIETGLTIAAGDVEISKDGGAFADKNSSTAPAHDSAGWYTVALDTTDTNTVGMLTIRVQVTGALPVYLECEVFPANVFDSRQGADLLQVDVSQFGNAAGTFASGRPEINLNPAHGMLLRAGTAQGGAAGTITLDAGASATDGFYALMNVTIVSGTGAGQTRTVIGYVGSTKVATITPNWVTNPDATSVFAIQPNSGSNLVAWRGTQPNGLSSGRVETVVGAEAIGIMTALTTIAGYIDTEVAAIKTVTDGLGSTLATIAGYIDTEVAAIKAKTDALPSDPADASDIAAAFSTVNSTLATIAGYIDTEIGAIKTVTDGLGTTLSTIAGYIDTEVAAIKAKTDNLPSDPADQSLLIAAISAVETKVDTVDTVADAIKAVTDKVDTMVEADSAVYRYTTNALEQAPAGGGGGGGYTPSQIADEVQTRTIAAVSIVNGLASNVVNAAALASDAVAEIQSGLATSSALATVAGYIDTEVGAILAAVDTEVAAIKTVTDGLGATLSTIAGYIDTEVAAIKAKTDNLPSDPADASDISASFSTVNSTLATIAGYIDTEVAAIKSVTDGLTSALTTINNNVSTVGGYVDTEVAAIKAVTDGINAQLTAIAGYIDTEVGAIKAKTDNLPSDPADASDLAASFSSLASSLTTVSTRLAEVWRLLGLDIAAPVTITPTSIEAGTIEQTIGGNGETTSTITRTA